MSDLKTLKDIEIRRPKGLELAYLDHYREEIKQESIRWIKELKKHEINDCSAINIQARCNDDTNFQASSIMELFCNITKEDLK